MSDYVETEKVSTHVTHTDEQIVFRHTHTKFVYMLYDDYVD